jgi:DNA-binding NtrC family response regulator
MAHLLLIDDDPVLIPQQVRQTFPAPRFRVEVADTGAEGIERVSAGPPDVILLDLRLPDQSGLEVYQQIRKLDARIPVIFVTLAKTADAAIEAMKQGAYDYLFKPLDLHQLRRVVGEALEVARRMREPAVVAETAPDPDVDGAIVGSCPAMREVYKAIGRVAAQNVPVLITGESGTGKELVARAIYQHGPRAKAPFLALNCAAIPEQLLESELFGVAPDALERLGNHPWPGNIRELQSALKQALLQASGTVLLTAFLPELGGKPIESSAASPAGADAGLEAFLRERLVPDANDLYAETHRQVDRLLLLRVLEFSRGNQHQAARLLGIARQTLRVKLRDLGLSVSHSVEADEEEQP